MAENKASLLSKLLQVVKVAVILVAPHASKRVIEAIAVYTADI